MLLKIIMLAESYKKGGISEPQAPVVVLGETKGIHYTLGLRI
jgi:hypothetical protein